MQGIAFTVQMLLRIKNISHAMFTVHVSKSRGHCWCLCGVQELGADEVIDYTHQTVDQVFQANPFDAVIDQIGGGCVAEHC